MSFNVRFFIYTLWNIELELWETINMKNSETEISAKKAPNKKMPYDRTIFVLNMFP